MICTLWKYREFDTEYAIIDNRVHLIKVVHCSFLSVVGIDLNGDKYYIDRSCVFGSRREAKKHLIGD